MTPLLLTLLLSSAPDVKSSAPKVEIVDQLAALRALPALHQKGLHVVHFWASWCMPCVDELPRFSARARELEKQGVDVTFISVDVPKDLEYSVVPDLVKAGANFPGAHLLLLGDSLDTDDVVALFDASWQGTVPATFVYRDGVRIAAYHSPLDAKTLEHLPGT